MEAMLIRERYKVTRVLYAEENYAFAEAVDILDREMTPYLLNIYEGPLKWRYLGYLDQLADCPEYHGMFLAGESLVTVFQVRQGREIDAVFFRGASFSWEERLDLTQALLHLALSQANIPPDVSCSALLSENVLVRVREKAFALRYMVRPLEGMNQRELVYLVGDQVKKILLRRFASVDAELAFLALLDAGTCHTVVQLYAAWREALPGIRGAYEKLYHKNKFKRGCSLLWLNIRRKLFGQKRR